MALLNLKIPEQNFEIVRDRLALILADEIAAQAAIAPLTPELDATVHLERFVPFSQVDMPCVNVVFASGSYDNQNAKTVDGLYKYNIDVYAKAKSTSTDGGDKLASIKLHSILGICRAILESPQYRTLGLAAPSLQRVTVVDINVEEPKNTQDGSSVIMGRLTFDVSVCEGVQLQIANNIAGWETSVEMDETDTGYKFSKVIV
tara:strand:+ start:4553 stop:5161 length:609 start_codon:yes stop_codon:yes gene_type:complete